MTAPAFHFEAKKYALRQAKDGVIVSFVVHPNDVVAELLSSPIGEHYVVALAPYEEKAAEAEQQPAPDPEKGKDRRPFHTLPRSQQAAMMCADHGFRRWLDSEVTRRIGAPPPGHPPHVEDERDAAQEVRDLCRVYSRRDLDSSKRAAAVWDALLASFRSANGWTTWERPA